MAYVLLLDDQDDERRRMTRVLEQALPDAVVAAPASPQEFARSLDPPLFDVVVTSESLAWADGPTVLAAARARLPGCPVVMVSERPTIAGAVAALRAGLDDYIPIMPPDNARLAVAVRSALDRSPPRQVAAEAPPDDGALAQQRMAFLAEASVLLASSLDYDTTLAHVVQLALGRVADWCSIYLQDTAEGGHWVAFRATDPAKQEVLVEIHTTYPPEHIPSTLVYRVLTTGEATYITDLTDARIAAAAVDARHLELYRSLDIQSYMVVPLEVRGQRRGVLVSATTRGGRHYTTADLMLVEELARRASVALDNAQLYAEAQSAISLRDQFLSIASHELRTPLTSLMGYMAMLLRRLKPNDVLGPRDLRALHVVNAQANRLDALISSLLDISRLQRGQLSIDPAPFDLRDLARQVVEEIEPTLEQHTITLDLPAAPVIINGDRLRLEQVVQNLVQNAIKYSPNGGPIEVVVELRQPTACLSVRDNGIGIPQEAISQLFNRFYRAANVEGTTIRGLGLGLFVVHEIMQLHGGDVEVESSEGCGSRFTLCFPTVTA